MLQMKAGNTDVRSADSDNNEYLQHNDDYECANDHEMELFNATKGSTKVGLMGRMLHVGKCGVQSRKLRLMSLSFRPNSWARPGE